jgi:hypothetical protein
MADSKVEALTENTNPDYTDVLYAVHDPSGTPVARRVKNQNVGLIKRATVTLNNAQIKALPTTPIEIVAAPGANKLIVPLRAIIRAITATAYTNVAALAAFTVGLENPGGPGSLLPFVPFGNALVEGSDYLATLPPFVSAVNATWGGPVIDGGNTANSWFDVAANIFLQNFDNSFVDQGNFGGGGAGNSMTVDFHYAIRDYS